MADQHKLTLFLLSAFLLLAPSCLKEMPESEEDLPQTVVWDPALAFPLGYDSFGMNEESGFDTTLFNIDSITGLPEWTNQLTVVMEGRVPFDLSSFSQDLNDINSVMFRVNMYNGFPHEILVQGYFLDVNMDTIGVLFESGTVRINDGGVRDGGASINPTILRKDAVFEREEIFDLQDAAEILLRGELIQVPEVDIDHIPFYPDYHFDVDIGTMVDITVDF